jgi:hypothetical protein
VPAASGGLRVRIYTCCVAGFGSLLPDTAPRDAASNRR